MTFASQQDIWAREHAAATDLPSLAATRPSSAVVWFIGWLHMHHRSLNGRLVDLGCGKGRNAVYLAQQGFDVTAIDYIDQAVALARAAAKRAGVVAQVDFRTGSITEPWPFADNALDYAVDCFSSIDIETLSGRQVYRRELFRTLKPGGLAFVAVVSTDDDIESELQQSSPASEPHSTIWPGSGKFQKNYTAAELRDFYADFQIVELRQVTKPAHKLGRDYTAVNFHLILQKPE